MKITFLGAAQSVTGSRFLLESGPSRILIDCGLFQERDLIPRNWEDFPANPAEIDAVLLTHAHIDHCGYLPKLVKEGFKGKIFCTPPTADITKISLLDSAKLQEADADYKRRRHKRENRVGPHPEVPLYTAEDSFRVFPRFSTIGFKTPVEIVEGVTATFFEAGHILGAAMIEVKVKDAAGTKSIVFSGDIGRWGRPILSDPHIFEEADHVVMEATYGDRLHEDKGDTLKKLEDVIHKTHRQKGNLIIPTFAIGRTQELLYNLNILLKEDRIPHLWTFVDSPMAMEITEIFKQYPQYFDKETQEMLVKYDELFDFPLLRFTPSAEESKAINHIKGTAIIMAGSGMCTGGRIKHHLARSISGAENTVLFVGYQAYGTLGRQILEKPKTVRILGEIYKCRAHIEHINGFSAHADKGELLKWASGFREKPKKVFIVHAEVPAAESLAAGLREKYGYEVSIPAYKSSHEL